jgi:hypothetical protein
MTQANIAAIGRHALKSASSQTMWAADLGDHDAPQPFLFFGQRLVRLVEAVVAELEIARPIASVERPPCRSRRPLHVCDRTVGGLPDYLFGRWMLDVEQSTGVGQSQRAVDERPLLAGQHTRVSVDIGHCIYP